MSDIRSVALDTDQALLIEQLGIELLRAGDERATKLLAIFLAWGVAGGSLPEARDSNVVELHAWSRKVTNG